MNLEIGDVKLSDVASKEIRDAIIDASNQMTIIEGYRDNLKEIKALLKDEYNLRPKIINALIKAYHKQAKTTMVDEANEFEELYSEIFKEEVVV